MTDISLIELCKTFAQEVCGYDIVGVSHSGIPLMEVLEGNGKATNMEVTRLLTSLSTLLRELEKFCKRPREDRPWIKLYYEIHYYVGRNQETSGDFEAYKCELRASIADFSNSSYWGPHDCVMVFGNSFAECLMDACIQGRRRIGVARPNY